MKQLSSNEIRKIFLDYFESKGHMVVPSASLIPDNDPSLLWINAGVAPLKKYFDGRAVPPKKRLVNVQKCLRTNDIENVGKTARHHTFFEMLGNFSIGDYFRDEALEYCFELLTSDKYYGIDKDKLYVTVYPDDEETYNKWLSLGVDKSHIIKCADNFWDIGLGPCGPDSEVFFDRGKEYDPDNLGVKLLEEDVDNERYVEIWNNVFSQYNHLEGLNRNEFPELPHKNIDTGMGLERLVCVIQGGKTNYDTDLFLPIIKRLEALTGVKYEGQLAFKVIADHVRTLVFALSDKASFSNEGRGYVLRRILRRAARYGRTLGLYEPFMDKLTGEVINVMKEAYPYLVREKGNVDKQIKKEEETFLKTLSLGEKRLGELVKSGHKITGEDVFKLYDTYGFPYELTEEMLSEKNVKIDRDEFDKYMMEQKTRARNANKNAPGMSVQGDLVNFTTPSVFTGYDELETESTVLFVGDENGNKADIYSEGMVILDKTPFYATMGGQLGDRGYLTNDNLKAEVVKCEKAPNGQNCCYVRIISGDVNPGDKVLAKVDKESRFTTCQNHSATHLLHYALRKVISNDITQAGSYVDDKTLRFDFRYTGKVTDNEIIEVERQVNEMIKACYPLEVKEMGVEEAKKTGAIALFDEKYGDVVRVVKFGESVELCGGTHVTNTGNIRSFAIKDVESKGLNIYRVEGVCDTNLETEIFSMIKPYNDEMILLLKKAKKIVFEALEKGIKLTLNVNISNERPRCYKDILENKEEVILVRKEIARLEREYKEALAKKLIEKTSDFASKKVMGRYGEVAILEFKNEDINALKSLCSSVLTKLQDGIVFIVNVKDDAINFVAKASDSLKDKINVGLLIKDVSVIAEGNGGGSATFAQGGGTNPDKLDMILTFVKSKIIDKE
ncbi:MAG: alanine--tRNA ligase [Bacilli bacterium]|nr:alanine--tRNA ligase [Bacilli bacterium]